MKNKLSLLFLFSLFYSCQYLEAQTPPVNWANQMQGNYNTYPVAMANDPQGNLYTAITFAQKMTVGTTTVFGGGYSAVCILKTDPSGQILWYKTITGGTGHYASSLVCDALGNIYVAGNFTGNALFGSQVVVNAGLQDGFITKLSSSGSFKWTKSLGGAGMDNAQALSLDASANLYVAGNFENSIALGTNTLNSAGLSDIVIATLDTANGSFLWSQALGSAQLDEAGPIACDPAGNLMVAGHFSISTIVGSTTLSSNGYRDAYLAALDPQTGTILWTEHMGSNGDDNITALAVDSKGNVYSAGSYAGILNYGASQFVCIGNSCLRFIKNRGNNGHPAFAKSFDNNGTFRSCNGLSVGPADQLYLAGAFDGSLVLGTQTLSSTGNYDTYLAQADTLGTFVWASAQGGALGDIAFCLSADAFGNIYTGGYFAGTMIYGSALLSVIGSSGGYMARWGNAPVNASVAEWSSAAKVSVYPNPFVNEITIAASTWPLAVRITDVFGKLVFESQTSQNEEYLKLPQHLAPGMYVLNLQDAGGQIHYSKLLKH